MFAGSTPSDRSGPEGYKVSSLRVRETAILRASSYGLERANIMHAQKRWGWGIVFVVALAVVALDQGAWYLRWRSSEYLTTLIALATATAAVGALVYVWLTYQLWRQAARQTESALMQGLMSEYDNLRQHVQGIQDWYDRHEDRAAALETFHGLRSLKSVEERHKANKGLGWPDDHRFKISRYFVKVRRLAEAGYLPLDLVQMSLEQGAIKMFLELVDPMDEVVCRTSGKQPVTDDRDFFRRLLNDEPIEAELSS